MPIGWVVAAVNGGPRHRTTSVGIGLGAVEVTADDWLGEGNAMVTIAHVGGARTQGGGGKGDRGGTRVVLGGWKAAARRLESLLVCTLSGSGDDFKVS